MKILRSACRIPVFIALLVLCLSQPRAFAAMESAPSERFADVDALMNAAVTTGNPPGAVVIIGHGGKIVYHKAFGFRSLEPTREGMTEDTIFDMASLTKPMATAMSVMKLVEQGRLRLNDPVAKYIPEFGRNGKEEITIRQLMTHFSGLREDLDLDHPWEGKQTAYRMVMDEKPVYPPGSRFMYSDINYITLGFVIEVVSGMPLDEFAQKNVFEPLGMEHTRFVPPPEWRSQIAATQWDEHHQMLRGVVHDPTARRMGGVAGHAGLFSTAADVAEFAQNFLTGDKVLSQLTREKMCTPQQPPVATSLRGLGWDIDSPFASNRGELLPVGSCGHTGFTGTSLWMDPVTNTYVILLANGVHPDGGKSLVSLRSRLATAVVTDLKLKVDDDQKLRLMRISGYNDTMAAGRRVPYRNGQVKTGIDVLEERNFSALKRFKRVGIVTNHTGVDAQGRRTIDVLAHVPDVQLAAIFSPEHGIAGALDTTDIGNGRDVATGVPIYSVYGDTDARRRPPLDAVKGLDAIVYDIQDVGVRFYTYETTLGYFLEAAAKTGTELIVLDRPNPINGAYVQGPISERSSLNFVDYHELPVRHGMTIGELAKLYNSERDIRAKLTVVPMEGWIRGDWYDSTSLTWINPSPNMRSVNEATLYPGVGLIEGTNISVGRGTDTPFELVGAPWVKAGELAAYLNARELSGVRFVPTKFTPASHWYANQACGGVNIIVVDRNVLDGPELGIELASSLQKLYPNQFKLEPMMEILGSQQVFTAIKAGEDPRRIAQDWQDQLDKFEEIRKKYLIY
jgi:uncharacterized protein YbbC (DUF1343 family)/CubicO group peptidase (beta-lactamase class C family)